MTIKQRVESQIQKSIQNAVNQQILPEEVMLIPVDLQLSAHNQPYDYTTSFCMKAAKKSQKNSKDIFNILDNTGMLNTNGDITCTFCEPGFLNIVVSSELMRQTSQTNTSTPTGKKYSVEFVSVNPNGPITVAAARGAAIGDVLANVLKEAGNEVTREYYINDSVNSEQMRLFAHSVKHHVCRMRGTHFDMPENGYKGDYVEDIAKQLLELNDEKQWETESIECYQSTVQAIMIEMQKQALKLFGTEFDLWVSEQELQCSGKVPTVIQELCLKEQAEYRDGALWLKSQQYGDTEDRVLIRADGRWTYAISDIAYHMNKYERGHDYIIDLFGPDHHGYIARLKAGVAALGKNPDTLDVLIFQAVRFVKDGQVVLMRKRDGNLYTLVDLINEVAEGMQSDFETAKDVVRFFYLYISANKHMDFDLDLAIKHANENPCIYLKYAHARCASILAKAPTIDANAQWMDVMDEPEHKLIIKCLSIHDEIQKCADTHNVHQIAHYAIDVSKMFHEFYEKCRVIQEDNHEQTQSRLLIVQLVKNTLKYVGDILGVSMPEQM